MRAIPMGIYMMATDLKRRWTEFFLYVLGIVGLVAFAGLRVGLTRHTRSMSLGLVDLEVLI
ncbi:hypothetical protein SLEP1_g15875 [Rubroshorea leprosula]|uniref:ABC transporter permease n=1 Tax=Rubroshorea leprosula TaxID=152421 RepID=A0AAV5IXS8_9ROSI|nr:hypothetical protein SLEP1_g15875 [Rubroshorea leprosula]